MLFFFGISILATGQEDIEKNEFSIGLQLSRITS